MINKDKKLTLKEKYLILELKSITILVALARHFLTARHKYLVTNLQFPAIALAMPIFVTNLLQ
jgi:hypothetical protein